MAQPVIIPPESQASWKDFNMKNKLQYTGEEDRRLISLVHQFGLRKWAVIDEEMVGGVGKQCREKWNNHLHPRIKKDIWTEDEERQSIQAHERLGNRWAEIAKYFSNSSTSTNSNFGTTTTAANPSNVGTRLFDNEDSTPFFSFESCNDEMGFMKTLFENNQSIDSIPVDHCQLMNLVEGTFENTYSFNIDENYNHPTIFFTSRENLRTTDSQLPAIEYVENDLFHSIPNPMGNKFFPSENSDLIIEFNSNFRSVETEASQIYPDELYFSYQWDGCNAGNITSTTNLPTIDQGTTFRCTMDTDLMDMVSSSQLPPQLSPYNGFF
ncbi:transcription factor MYB119-like [Olea europaea var. sylvestris]|uniref:transcription factor MYB119-like n=1 Tax=Olea europaea var. sylvestris TaxID=158386 RepID=UPI000C1D66FE|nr:transcription factor MYB119-like [Olea europaea var. sylvestris]